jgi:hypothetical protein
MGAAATGAGRGGARPNTGGKRQGSGRKPGVPNKSTAELKALAQAYGPAAIELLAKVMKTGSNETVRIAAARELLDRGYGRPVQQVAGDPDGEPVTVQTIITGIMRDLEGTGRGLPSDAIRPEAGPYA